MHTWLYIQSQPGTVARMHVCIPASACYVDSHGFDPHIQHHSFVEIGHEINFYGHSLPSTDSRNTKECALVLVNCLGGLPRNSVDRLTDHARNDLKHVEGP